VHNYFLIEHNYSHSFNISIDLGCTWATLSSLAVSRNDPPSSFLSFTKTKPLAILFPPSLFNNRNQTFKWMECEEDMCVWVCVSFYVSNSRAKKIRSTEKFKIHKIVLKHLSHFVSSNSIIFFTKPRAFWRRKLNEQASQG